MKNENRSRKQSQARRNRSRKNQNVSISSDSVYDSVAYHKWKLGCRSRKQKRKNQPIAKSGIEHCHWFILPLLLATPTMQRRSRKRNQKKWKRSDSSDSDSVELMTPLTTPIFDFHLVVSSRTTRTRTLTQSLVKTSQEILTEFYTPGNMRITNL